MGQEAQEGGTWQIGSLHPTMVKVLTALGFVLPMAGYLAMVAHYQVNAIWADQWGDVHVLVQNAGRFPNWSSLWGLHTDNRVFFPNLIVIALSHTVRFNIEVEEYLSALMLFGATALLIWAHKRRSPATPLIYYCPVAFLMLTFAQSQDSLWGFQMAWYLVLLALAVSMVLLDRQKFAWPILVCSIVAAAVGSYSSVQGLLIWPVRARAALPPPPSRLGLRQLDRSRTPSSPLCTFTTTTRSRLSVPHGRLGTRSGPPSSTCSLSATLLGSKRLMEKSVFRCCWANPDML